MKTIDNIPTSKIQRATKMVATGAKVGVNYIKYYGDKLVNPEKEAKQRLNKNTLGYLCFLALLIQNKAYKIR